MLVQTTIKPRRDGTVKVIGQDGSKLDFVANESGDLVCDVEDKETLKKLLANGAFIPYDEKDFEAAEELVVEAEEEAKGEDDEGPEASDDDEETEIVNGGLPIEAETPPKRMKPRKAR